MQIPPTGLREFSLIVIGRISLNLIRDYLPLVIAQLFSA